MGLPRGKHSDARLKRYPSRSSLVILLALPGGVQFRRVPLIKVISTLEN